MREFNFAIFTSIYLFYFINISYQKDRRERGIFFCHYILSVIIIILLLLTFSPWWN